MRPMTQLERAFYKAAKDRCKTIFGVEGYLIKNKPLTFANSVRYVAQVYNYKFRTGCRKNFHNCAVEMSGKRVIKDQKYCVLSAIFSSVQYYISDRTIWFLIEEFLESCGYEITEE